MTTAPFEPDPHTGREEIAAADPGQGAPDTAEGFGAGAGGPDLSLPDEDDTTDEPEE